MDLRCVLRGNDWLEHAVRCMRMRVLERYRMQPGRYCRAQMLSHDDDSPHSDFRKLQRSVRTGKLRAVRRGDFLSILSEQEQHEFLQFAIIADGRIEFEF